MNKEIKILVLILGLVIVGAVGASFFYRSSVQSEQAKTPEINSNLVREDSPTMGPADAKVTIVEFLDPECESCAAFSPVVKKIMKENDGHARLVIRYLNNHHNSDYAANFLEAAGEQGKYWQALDLLLAKQPEWGEVHSAPPTAQKPDVKKLFQGYAMQLGLDIDKMEEAVRTRKFQQKFDRDRRDASAVNARQTPTIFVNGRRLARLSEAELRALVQDELKKS
jgi:protein-disulfide isomerase